MIAEVIEHRLVEERISLRLALLRRPVQIPGVPSRPKRPAQPLALDVGSPRAALVAGNCINSSHVTRSPHPTGPACSHDPCAFVYIFWRLPPARFANGRGPVPLRDAGLRGRRDRRWPAAVARGDVCFHVGVITNAHRLCRVLLAFLFELPGWRCRRHRRV
jgi:hypothetical protein